VAQVLIGNKELADFFESSLAIYLSPKEIANWIVTDLMSFIDESHKKEASEEKEYSLFAGLKVRPEHIADLARLVDQGMINRATAKQVLGQVVRTSEMPSVLVKKMHASRIDDISVLAQAVQSVFEMEHAAVQDARHNTHVANFLLGKVMKITKGKADPKIVLEIIQKKLKED
ncbi:MAG: Asp-tRNA(Asn)/Glu-tRNA(Gln) amidotransferase GatCAB subunit B, partial [Thermoproteota archaeon]|nr:Asp-tRNA(Asn)/Glu-tRNA(Gln) amidotransferase GatCAB subunit B [Thermoproteota archaeon]